jgi:type I restriction enzyme M protein
MGKPLAKIPERFTTSSMARRTTNQPALLTTPQRLASTIKSARDIMRKDKGLNGDLDRLPMLTWLMFLKFLDDMETERKINTELEGKRYYPLIEPPYRWQDWARSSLTGEALISFINNDEAPGPDGKRGPGLFEYLGDLQSAEGGDTRDVIRTVFSRIHNRMESGYLLKDVIGKVDQIHFTSSEEIHTLGTLYESMLREMRDAAGDGGEFYTPRPVVRFMVNAIDPKLGETVLDPACGTGGFLAEAFAHLQPQCKKAQDYETLQKRSIFGQEAKSLPYLLSQMNLVLHGLENPQISDGNSLAVKLTEIGDNERVDIILTNPPFGGEEEAAIKSGFPADKQTGETALLFLQLIMRRLRRHPNPGRAAVVVPNGLLFGDGVSARIKKDLLENYNLHTIVRLPNGVFAPYTPIPTNLLFFDRSGCTKEVWYYELSLPEQRKTYSKTAPIQDNEFIPVLTWWDDRKDNERAWKVSANSIVENGYNLDSKNPSAKANLEHMPPEDIVASILQKERKIISILEELQAELLPQPNGNGATA